MKNDKKYEILFYSVIELRKLIYSKEISPVEITKLALERIEKVNPKINAFLTVTAESAIEKAKEVEKKILKKERVGLLAGIPTSIKDLEPMKGVRQTKGSIVFEDFVADVDQIAVERIKNEDGIILGKTNTPEFGASGTTENKLGDHCRNPWDLECVAGGSSGGAGASIASGITPVAQGSDGGGSIRIPSAFCGIYGIKATQGRVPRRNIGNLSWHPVNYSSMGPMSRYVLDSALFLQVISGPHPESEFGTLKKSPPDFLLDIEKGISGKLIGWSPDLGSRIVDDEVKNLTQKAVESFEELGANVELFNFDINLDELEEPLHNVLSFALSYATNGYLLEKKSDYLMHYVRNTLEQGKKITTYKYIESLTKLYEFRNKVEHIFKQYDYIATPTMGMTAFKCDTRPFFENNKIKFKDFDNGYYDYSSWNLELTQFTALFNWSSNPAAALPCGFSSSGLPVSLQIIGKKEDEVGVLQASRSFEKLNPWHHYYPDI
ncbi:MAG: hypothetical protein CL764_02445 [Chloroflexi bacterium]|nr:hypothetical protein [Chloroflexota bacterium]|tara:strand:- start:10872 stop:12347 length:1476 start_codon:yes stop_codon:yes gene_type:complete